MFNDNATNFIGACHDLLELKEILAKKDRASLAQYATARGMNCVMTPPRTPKFGGLWEGGAKSAKHNLRKLVSNITLTMEEFTTLLTQKEAILNSRPISPMSSDLNDDAPLSPGLLLTGREITALPEKSPLK